jgi:hypothetical protein
LIVNYCQQQAVTFMTEWMEEKVYEASLTGAVIGQASTPVPPIPTTIEEAVPKEVLSQGEPVVPRASEGPSLALIRVSGDPQAWGDPRSGGLIGGT